ncbi:MAG: 2-C-methyl-D-erythritol 2,4-cyclodiphosphate synthase [Aquificae bacterium]|nr:2-C-methyl-D-erythritol 2,4-cyclodiphosphate synthase [Aquificota bacterium]
MDIRIGIGFDIHRLEEGRKLIIGGVEIPYEKGWVAHSDGDIFFHALTDALLGAIGYGDIGELFPDNQAKWKNVDSSFFLKEAYNFVKKEGYEIINIDGYIILQKPKLLPYRRQIIENTAKILNINESQIFIKGKTFEKIGEIGEGKAGLAEVIVLLKK